MEIVERFAEARVATRGMVGLVPTMGFFHEGHLSLMRSIRRRVDSVMVSLFVNPLQFGEGEDLDRYPRNLERDAALAEAEGVDVLFVPPDGEMYPGPVATRVTVGPLSEGLCGRSRPGHFEGVATVVAKLFAGLQPNEAAFGRKDAQQLAVIRRMATDLSFPVRIVGLPVVREQDGLALSSRNVYLEPDQRDRALSICRGLMAAAEAAEGGETDGAVLEGIARSRMVGLDVEYVELTDATEVTRLARLDRDAFLAVAGRVGSVRLIDNVHFAVGGERPVADRGARLAQPSILYGGK